MIYNAIKQLCEILSFRDINTIYLTLIKFLITHGISSWSEAYDNNVSNNVSIQYIY